MTIFGPFLKLAKELDVDKVESWAKGLSDRWINNDDLKRKGIQKIFFGPRRPTNTSLRIPIKEQCLNFA